MSNPFDDLPDMTPRGTIKRTLPHAFVRSDKPLELELRHANVNWNKEYDARRTQRAADWKAARDSKNDDAFRTLRDDLYAETVIVGWANCNAKDGTALAYTPALGKQLLEALHAKGLDDEINEAIADATVTSLFRSSPAAVVEALGK